MCFYKDIVCLCHIFKFPQEPSEKPERLRQRPVRKPSYAEDADEDMDWESDGGKERDIEQSSSKTKKKKQVLYAQVP